MGRGMVRGAALLASMAWSLPVLAQENRFDLSVRIVETYDTNILRVGSERFDGPTDNLSVTPQVGVDFNRSFGRQRVFLNGTAGYAYNSRFPFLDREDLSLSGGANLQFSGRCRADPAALIFRSQSDLDDLGAVVANTVTFQDYSVRVSCPRPAGFYPAASLGFLRVDNSRVRRERNQSIVDVRGGLVYRRPSLGEAELFAQSLVIARDRNDQTDAGVFDDESEVSSFGVRVSRNVGTRVSASASASYTRVDNRSPLVPDFSGVTYDGAVTYEPHPRLSVTAAFGRTVGARNNLGTSYSVARSAALRATARFTARISAGAGLEVASRDFRGEDPTFRFGPRGSDRQVTANANVSYALSRPIALTLTTRYRDRDADNDFYDFSSFAATLGASLRL